MDRNHLIIHPIVFPSEKLRAFISHHHQDGRGEKKKKIGQEKKKTKQAEHVNKTYG